MEIPKDELKIEFFRSSGKGGQNVNKVESAVRITHLPTGITATCQDERDQGRNRQKAMAVLVGRLVAARAATHKAALDAFRNAQLASGRVRTYDLSKNLVTDHRRGTKTHRVRDVLDGNLDLLEA